MTYLRVLLVCAAATSTVIAVANTLADCNAVAASFKSTCPSGASPYANVAAVPSSPISCTSASTANWCPATATLSGSTCTINRRLCVTCYESSGIVKMRIQSNGIPNHCIMAPVKMSEQDFDFEVSFNVDVTAKYASPYYSAATAADVTTTQCNIQRHSDASVPAGSGYVKKTTAGMDTVLGISVNGVAILNPNSANNVDPFYPLPYSSSAVEHVDIALGHPQAAGIYHYHAPTRYMADGQTTTALTACDNTAACSSGVAAYSLSGFTTAYKSLTAVGIAKDGHVIYGPYDSSGALITSMDTCGGSFVTADLSYAYIATNTWPYISGCFGPGNYPSSSSVVATCSSNTRTTAYTASSYIQAFANPSATPSATPSSTPSLSSSPSPSPSTPASSSPSPSRSQLPSPSAASTPSITGSPSTAATGTSTATAALSPGASASNSATQSAAQSVSASASPSLTATPSTSSSGSRTGSGTGSGTGTGTGTGSVTATPSPSGSSSGSRGVTVTPSTPSASPTGAVPTVSVPTSAGSLSLVVLLRPAGDLSAALTGGTVKAVRLAVVNATMLDGSRVRVTAVNNSATGAVVTVAADSSINTDSGAASGHDMSHMRVRRGLADSSYSSAASVRDTPQLPHMRARRFQVGAGAAAASNDSIAVSVVIDVPYTAAMTAAQADAAAQALSTAVAAGVASGAFSAAASSWAVATGTSAQPQALSLAAAMTSFTSAAASFAAASTASASPGAAPQTAPNSSSDAAAIGGAIGGTLAVAVVIVAAVVWNRSRAKRRAAAAATAAPAQASASGKAGGSGPHDAGASGPGIAFTNPAKRLPNGAASTGGSSSSSGSVSSSSSRVAHAPSPMA